MRIIYSNGTPAEYVADMPPLDSERKVKRVADGRVELIVSENPPP